MIKTNIVGERYGRLTVVSPTVSKHNKARWICKCDCGKTCIGTGASLRNGKKKSCGCLAREASIEKLKQIHERGTNILPPGEAARNALYCSYHWQAERRNLEFKLSKEEFNTLISGNCFYCGSEPKQIGRGSGSISTTCLYNGIDRQDNAKGYILENCVSCCGICNDMKRIKSVTDFIKACESVVNHQTMRSQQKCLTTDNVS